MLQKIPTRCALATVLLLLGVEWSLARPLVAVEDPPAAGDPVVHDVVRLLEAHLGEPLILRWLEDNDAHPGALDAGDLVTLKQAGASDELITALLDRVRDAAAPGAPAAAAPAEAVAPAPGSHTMTDVPLDVALRYIHIPDEGEPWDLVVYLDGTPWPPLVAASSERSARIWAYNRVLTPGPHVVRWAQERHRDRKGERWLHAARFAPESLAFTLAPAESAKLEFEFRDRTGIIKRFGGPIDARATQGERTLAEVHSNGDPLDWKLLCEDIETSLAGAKPGIDDRRALRYCVHWATLWSGVPELPSRDAVRPPVR